MDFAFNVPINSVSFGQVSTCLLREAYRRKLDFPIFPIGSGVDLSSQEDDEGFFDWVKRNYASSERKHSRSSPTFKLWHLKDSLSSMSERQLLLSFYELDSPTDTELNIAKNNNLAFTSKFAIEAFRKNGVESKYIPLPFDSDNFKRMEKLPNGKDFYEDDRIVFTVCGKVEKRKRHEKIIRAWAKRFGGDKRYFLHCSIYNGFLSPEDNNGVVARILQNKTYININFFPSMTKNATYNEFLNGGHIIIGMSGGEGWGLPEFQSVAIGKHSVIMDAHGYKSWANEQNSVLVSPDKKIDVYDNVFFKKDSDYNQGQIFDFDEDAFIDGCEKAIERHKASPVNEEGLKLKEEFTPAKTIDTIISNISDI